MSLSQYDEYQDTGIAWLGKVPAHWRVVSLKRLIDIQNGADHKTVEQSDGYPVFGSGGRFAYSSAYLYDGESILLGRKGTIDRPMYVTGRFWTVDTMYWSKIRDGVSGRYAYYAATTIPFSYYSTNTALPSMTQESLNGHVVALPPLVEQVAIARFLDRETASVDALVAEQKRLVELLKEKRQAVVSHVVTKGLNPDAPMKDSGIRWLGSIPAHWTVPPLYTRFDQALGKMLDQAKMTGEWSMPYLRNIDVRWGYCNVDDLPVMDIRPEEKARFTVRKGDLLLVEGRDLGRCAIWSGADNQIAFQKALHRLRPRDATESPRYFYYLMVFANAVGVFFADQLPNEIPHLTGEELRAHRFPKPPVGEQLAIADALDREAARVNGLLTEAERSIALLQERRTALISAAVTGQIDVRAAAERSAA